MPRRLLERSLRQRRQTRFNLQTIAAERLRRVPWLDPRGYRDDDDVFGDDFARHSLGSM
jgi:hypothetical protein